MVFPEFTDYAITTLKSQSISTYKNPPKTNGKDSSLSSLRSLQAKSSLSLSHKIRSSNGGSNLSISQANGPPSLLRRRRRRVSLHQVPNLRPPSLPPPSSPKPPPASRRRFCCCFFLWLTLVLLGLIFLAAIAGGVFYVLYRPHSPDFTVSSVNLEQFDLTSGGSLTTRLDLAVTARNPNKKISFLYDPISIAVSSGGVTVGRGSFPALVHEAKSTTVMKAAVSSKGQSLDSAAAAELRRKSRLPLAVDLETRAGVKIGGWKTKRIGIEVSCDGFGVAAPKKKAGKLARAKVNVSCKVKLRIKIWKWTVYIH